MIVLEYQNIKIYFEKVAYQIRQKEIFAIKKDQDVLP